MSTYVTKLSLILIWNTRQSLPLTHCCNDSISQWNLLCKGLQNMGGVNIYIKFNVLSLKRKTTVKEYRSNFSKFSLIERGQCRCRADVYPGRVGVVWPLYDIWHLFFFSSFNWSAHGVYSQSETYSLVENLESHVQKRALGSSETKFFNTWLKISR